MRPVGYALSNATPSLRAIRTTDSFPVMTTRKVSRHNLRQRLVRARELYLRDCYRKRTAARADEFSEHLRVTRPYLSRMAPQALGMPVRDFLRQGQLEYAKKLLETTPLSTVQIAYAAAFGTRQTFYRCFKAAFGMTPGAYRKQVTK